MTFEVDSGAVAILAVEDDVMVWMIVTDILADAGFRVIEAHDAHEAMNLLEERSDVQVMVTDYNMLSDIDGVGLAHVVRQRWPSVGVIVTSDKVQSAPDDLPAGVQLLKKPYRPSALIEAVNAVAQGSDEVAPGAPVLLEGIMMHSPVRAEVGGMGIAAAPSEPDKT